MSDPEHMSLVLYYAMVDDEFQKFTEELRETLSAHFPPGSWSLELVDVITMPEKAIANDVFTTPTLVRAFPEPILKILGQITHIQQVMVVVTHTNHDNFTIVL